MVSYERMKGPQLDALAAERMGMRGGIINGIFRYVDDVTGAGGAWSPTTDANDRDEWLTWLWQHPRHARIQITHDGVNSVASITLCRDMGYKHGHCCGHLGFAAVIAGLRATDDSPSAAAGLGSEGGTTKEDAD